MNKYTKEQILNILNKHEELNNYFEKFIKDYYILKYDVDHSNYLDVTDYGLSESTHNEIFINYWIGSEDFCITIPCDYIDDINKFIEYENKLEEERERIKKEKFLLAKKEADRKMEEFERNEYERLKKKYEHC